MRLAAYILRGQTGKGTLQVGHFGGSMGVLGAGDREKK